MTQKYNDTHYYSNSPQELNHNQSSGRKTGSTALRKTTELGYNITKKVGGSAIRATGRLAKGTAKRTGKFALRTLWKLIIANAYISIPIIIVAVIVMLGVGSMASSMFVVYAKGQMEKAQSSVIDTYADYLGEVNKREVINYTEEGVNTDPTQNGDGSLTGNNGANYGDTIESAEMLDGKSLMAQAYNAMLASQQKYNVAGYNMEFMYGIAVTETCCSPIKWMFYMPIGNDYNASGNYDIMKYGVSDFMKSRDAGNVDMSSFTNTYNDGSQYITSYQMAISLFKQGTPAPSGWSSSKWVSVVNGMTSNLDANGDGKVDPFNFPDTLNVLGNYITASRWKTISKIKLKSDTDKEDMMLMAFASRHVGTSNKTKSRSDGCSFSGHETNPEWRGNGLWCYPYIEGLNPHIDLMRSAVNEYKSNGPIFREYQAFMQGQSKTNSNGGSSLTIIEKLYAREGWKKDGSGRWSKAFGDGDGKVTVAGQDVAYIFRAYWGAKIGFPEFEKLAKNT